MKKYLEARLRLSALTLAVAFGAFVIVTPKISEAQSAPEKIRLMADALRARDSGNLELAKERAEELIRISPNDENVQRLLASINRELDRQGGAAAPSPGAIFGQVPEIDIEAAMLGAAEPTSSLASGVAADPVVHEATTAQLAAIASANNAIAEAKLLGDLQSFDQARNLLLAAADNLTLNTATAPTLDALDAAQRDLVVSQAKALIEAGNLRGAEAFVDQYRDTYGESRVIIALSKQIERKLSDPYELDINVVNPEFVANNRAIRDLLARGRAQFLNGDYDGASNTFNQIEARDANNAEAKLFQRRIAEILGDVHAENFYKTRAQMLTEVDQGWERPKVFDITEARVFEADIGGRIQEKMNSIVIPQVNFSGMELTRVIETLSELSVEYDPDGVGINIIPLYNPNDRNPRVNISLRNLNLDRILQFVTQQVNFGYDVGADAVTVAPSDSADGVSNVTTEFFPVTRATIIRLTGFRDGPGSSSSGPIDPFAAPLSGGGGTSVSEEVEALQSFFQRAGVNFELPGASLAFDGEQLIVTQTRRNLERMRTILRNYNEVKQVEIETKFLEVSQNDLEEVGFDWAVSDAGRREFNTRNRSLANSFSIGGDSSSIRIASPAPAEPQNVPFLAPALPTSLDFAEAAGSLFEATGWSVNGYDVNFAIRALSRKSGSNLMSAPKVTVLSGKRANIVVAQELRYPERYGDIDSQVGSSGSSGGGGETGASSISITAGTPQDFVTRNVGVEMSVTPNVENDDTISLVLEPRVTEFEGFVEYGGPSVAIGSDGTVVTVPAGFFQPIFSVREITTEVTVFDGATVVMGGLTRDEVKTVNDRVPVLGNIPGVGRLFRSEGETRQKRNLLIFVTANLVSPGGSPSRQSYRNVNANSLFQNPTIMTPSGAVNRSIEAGAE